MHQALFILPSDAKYQNAIQTNLCTFSCKKECPPPPRPAPQHPSDPVHVQYILTQQLVNITSAAP